MAIKLGEFRAYIDFVGMEAEILWLMNKAFPGGHGFGNCCAISVDRCHGLLFIRRTGTISNDREDAEAYFIRFFAKRTAITGVGLCCTHLHRL